MICRLVGSILSFNQMTENIAPSQKAKARRRELVGITHRLIAAKGLEGLRTRDVADAASTDTGTLHYHFPSKELLVQAVVERLGEDFRANRAARAHAATNAFAELRNEVFDVVSRVHDSPQDLMVMMDFIVRASRDPAVAEILGRTRRAWKAELLGLFRRGIAQGVFRADVEPEIAASLLQAQLVGLALAGLADPLQAKSLAAALLAQLQAWLSKPQA